ncbi:MAG: response regulator [Betaproteobacteria bacterium]|nr:response regulator [Betaproteobacteria bacterium]
MSPWSAQAGRDENYARSFAIVRGLSWAAGLIASAVAVSLPLLFFWYGYTSLEVAGRAEARIKADALALAISENPQYWSFQQYFVDKVLRGVSAHSYRQSSRIVDENGVVLAAHDAGGSGLTLVRSAPLYDAGRRVGEVEVTIFAAPLLRGTGWAGALGLVLGALVFLVLRTLPLAALKRTLAALEAERDRAEKAGRARASFLAMMSHEIRTPMNGVIGMTSLLLNSALTPKQRDYAETIRLSGETLLTVINDILDFSKIESGKLQLEEQPFVLTTCVEDAFSLVSGKAAQKSLDLVYLIKSDVPSYVVGDVTRLRQVLVNLVDNAVKFTERGEVLVTVSRATDEGPHALRFEVKDSGIGIKPEILSTLFRPFTQADSSTTRRFGGTGLGLAICARLVDIMGGRIGAESSPGSGSRFFFTIVAHEAPGEPVHYLQRDAVQIAGRRVMIVDDNGANLNMLRGIAERWGLECAITASPLEALRWVETGEPYDLALLDQHMPEIDGVELARRLQALREKLPIILLSSTEVGNESGRLRLAASLTKPVRQGPLFDAIVRALGGTVSGKPVSAAEPQGPLAGSLPLRILVAEDNAVNALLVRALLERLGYRSDLAGNGLEAVEACRRQSYDIVMMDVQMPEMDGIEATRKIREERAGPLPIVIALTANVLSEDREICHAAGMNDFLPKPVTLSDLRGALERNAPRVRTV